MKRLCVFIACLVLVGINLVQAQTVRITGTVKSSEDGIPIPGVSIVVKGTTVGGITNADGKYEINVPANATTLVFSFIGMKTQEVEIAGRIVIDATIEPATLTVDEVVVTALGISRQKKGLGYATQEVKGEAINAVKTENFVNSLSGKVSGVKITRNTNMGGSTNIVIRGSKSLTGNNQALFVVDGVPVSNNNTNTTSQSTAGTGYDYGNAASDINPDDIESVNVLKGAAATALYGSRAANGVIMITTKKGAKKDKGLGITVSSNVTIGSVDKSTFPKYQTQYGGGYGKYYDDASGYFWFQDVTGAGPELIVPLTEDASYGAPFDPTLMVYQWDAFDLESPNYHTKTPWVNSPNGPITYFKTPVTYNNSIAIDNSFDKGSYRLGWTSFNQNAMLPNSYLKKNNFTMSGTYKLSDKLTATGFGNFITTKGKGRNSTGYNDNQMGSFRQWYQVNVDLKEQEASYFRTRRNTTWNYAGIDNLSPIYWDNPYWQRYENYETDGRDRFIGNMSLNYQLTSWLDVFARVSADSYNELQEERRNVGSVAGTFGIGTSPDGSGGRPDATSGYSRKNISSSEVNYDMMLNFNKNLTDKLNVKGTIGSNTRRTNYNWILAATNGGIGVPGLYSLQNSANPVPFPKEAAQKIGVNGLYASVNFGYDDFLYLDATVRRDVSSTLPKGNNKYFYPSVAGSFVFSKFIKASWLSFGKIRANYAQVGNGAPFDYINDTYAVLMPLGGAITSVSSTKANANLKPETSTSIETGLEMYFLDRRFGFDLAYYKTNSVDMILPVALSNTTGFSSKILNAGELENKGIELTINGTPVKMKDFSWDVSINWTKNQNKVVKLAEGLDNLQLGRFQGGVTINARVGQPYGTIQGTDYTYLDGQKVINASNGRYISTSTSDNVLGNINPDWIGGISNRFTYKNLSFSFLVDMQKGGEIFSLDMYYGLATGLYEETAFLNDLGNPVRNPIVGTPGAYAATSGGMINPGVNNVGGTAVPNITRIACTNYGAFGYARGLPNKAFVYDAGYIKLREVSLSWNVPSKFIAKTFLRGATVSFVGSNLWIMKKSLPHADPESGLGAGNLQGYSTGSLPSTRDFGFNIKLQF
jgi:TonB-linked SusC/RagA family outer membrane protein